MEDEVLEEMEIAEMQPEMQEEMVTHHAQSHEVLGYVLRNLNFYPPKVWERIKRVFPRRMWGFRVIRISDNKAEDGDVKMDKSIIAQKIAGVIMAMPLAVLFLGLLAVIGYELVK